MDQHLFFWWFWHLDSTGGWHGSRLDGFNLMGAIDKLTLSYHHRCVLVYFHCCSRTEFTMIIPSSNQPHQVTKTLSVPFNAYKGSVQSCCSSLTSSSTRTWLDFQLRFWISFWVVSIKLNISFWNRVCLVCQFLENDGIHFAAWRHAWWFLVDFWVHNMFLFYMLNWCWPYMIDLSCSSWDDFHCK